MTPEFRDSPNLSGFPYRAKGISYLVTLRLAEDQPLLTEESEAADFLLETVQESAERNGFIALAAVVMPDHLHFIVQNQEGEEVLADYLRKFKSYTTNQLWNYGFDGEVWQRKYYERKVKPGEDFRKAVNYIRRNPLEEELVDDPDDWKWLKVWAERI